jgi:predicted short-subunit dehydrogenase-like oxidoreductase (DUF2520 family)
VKNKGIDISIVGTGNLAWQLGQALQQAGYRIGKVWGRNRSDREALGRLLEAEATADLNSLPADGLCLLLVTDGEIANIAAQITPSETRLMVHAAGAGQLDWLLPHPRRAVMWPMQSIRKELSYDWKAIPLLCDAQQPSDLAQLLALASSISEHAVAADQRTRDLYHLAAVTTANFQNYLLEQAFELLQAAELDHRLLLPLLQYQLDAFASNQAPWERQTGPARRLDTGTLEKHLQLISERPDHAALYRLFSQLIVHKSAAKS